VWIGSIDCDGIIISLVVVFVVFPRIKKMKRCNEEELFIQKKRKQSNDERVQLILNDCNNHLGNLLRIKMGTESVTQFNIQLENGKIWGNNFEHVRLFDYAAELDDFILAKFRNLYRFNLHSGQWSVLARRCVDSDLNGLCVCGKSVVYCDKTLMVKVDICTGEQCWTSETSVHATSMCYHPKWNEIIACGGCFIHRFDADSGEQLDAIDLREYLPCISKKNVFIDENGKLYIQSLTFEQVRVLICGEDFTVEKSVDLKNCNKVGQGSTWFIVKGNLCLFGDGQCHDLETGAYLGTVHKNILLARRSVTRSNRLFTLSACTLESFDFTIESSEIPRPLPSMACEEIRRLHGLIPKSFLTCPGKHHMDSFLLSVNWGTNSYRLDMDRVRDVTFRLGEGDRGMMLVVKSDLLIMVHRATIQVSNRRGANYQLSIKEYLSKLETV